MPELPEVETTVRSLNALVPTPFTIVSFKFNRSNIRNKIPVSKIKRLRGPVVRRIYRRAKFIIFELDNGYILSHLGMTGSWRKEKRGLNSRAHDHVLLHLTNDEVLIFNDPRRFGEFDYVNSDGLTARFKNFGPEPLDVEIDWKQMTGRFKKSLSPIKVALMNQKYLVGVGNIYASEALFRAGINPKKKACRVGSEQYSKLWKSVQEILQLAIESGGSTIQDFKNGYGELGEFQKSFKVYDREGFPCTKCDSKIKSFFMGGRSTFWCPKCQAR